MAEKTSSGSGGDGLAEAIERLAKLIEKQTEMLEQAFNRLPIETAEAIKQIADDE